MTNTESTVWADQNSQFSPKANSLGMKVNLIQLQVFHWRWVAFFQCQDFATAQVAAVKRKDLSSHRLWEKKILLQSTNETQTFQFYKKHICLWESWNEFLNAFLKFIIGQSWDLKLIFQVCRKALWQYESHNKLLRKNKLSHGEKFQKLTRSVEQTQMWVEVIMEEYLWPRQGASQTVCLCSSPLRGGTHREGRL